MVELKANPDDLTRTDVTFADILEGAVFASGLPFLSFAAARIRTRLVDADEKNQYPLTITVKNPLFYRVLSNLVDNEGFDSRHLPQAVYQQVGHAMLDFYEAVAKGQA